MVQLSALQKKPEGDASKQKQKAPIELTAADEGNSTVYGSKFADEDLPRHEMPEGEMPREIAYRLIKDDLSLDGNPKLKYVLFLF